MIRYLFLFFIAATQLVAGCRKKSEQPFLRFGQQTVSLPPVAGTSIDVVVESNVGWTLSTNAGWLQLSETTGNGKDTVRITVREENLGELRAAVIVAASANASPAMEVRLTVDQKPYNLQVKERRTLGGNRQDHATAIVATNDGGHVVVGYSTSNNSVYVTNNYGSYDYWVVRLNNNHDTLWTRVLGGLDSDVALAAAETPDGGFVVAGYTFSAGTGVVPAGHGGRDAWLVKLTGNGVVAWTRTLGGSDTDLATAVAVAQDGSIVVAGRTLSTNIAMNQGSYHGGVDMLVIKLTAAGSVLWTRTLGGSDYETAEGVAVDEGGNIVLAGFTMSSNNGDVRTTNRGGRDLWTVRLTTQGDTVWTRMRGGTAQEGYRAIAATPDGAFIAAGYTNSSDLQGMGATKGGNDCLVMKLKANGDTEWMQMLGGSGNDEAAALAVTTDGGCIVAAMSESDDFDVTENYGEWDYFLARLNVNGQKIWATTIGGNKSEYIGGIVMKRDAGFTIAGHSFTGNDGHVNSSNYGEQDWWIVNMRDY